MAVGRVGMAKVFSTSLAEILLYAMYAIIVCHHGGLAMYVYSLRPWMHGPHGGPRGSIREQVDHCVACGHPSVLSFLAVSAGRLCKYNNGMFNAIVGTLERSIHTPQVPKCFSAVIEHNKKS